MQTMRLTDESFWDDYWSSVRLPIEIKKSNSLLVAEITDVVDRFLRPGRPLSVLEVGGAPGQYAAYVHRLGHPITVLDSSPVGCAKARKNFELLGMTATVVQGDFFDPPHDLPLFDVVYSLGLIEHFEDVTAAVSAHAALLAPGGTMLLGAPNLYGINGWLLGRLSPSFLGRHQVEATYERTWDRFERELSLTRLFRGYLGGFDAGTFWRCESARFRDRALRQALAYLSKGLERPSLRFLRRANARYWSAYLMAAYRIR
jgi:SAM-dependent methyltransferase